jgi:fumarate hydratase class II
MGEMEVPADALCGASRPAGRPELPIPASGSAGLIRASRSSSRRRPDERRTGLLTPAVAAAIAAAAADVADGAHDDQFPIDVYQTGRAPRPART